MSPGGAGISGGENAQIGTGECAGVGDGSVDRAVRSEVRRDSQIDAAHSGL